MPITVIEGLQRGDEGKGRFVDMLAPEHDIVARYNGGHNAGHTVVTPDGTVLKLHLVPSGITYPHIVNVIGNGTVLDAIKLKAEIEDIESKGFAVTPDNLMISSAAHLITPEHISEDEIREHGAGQQGTTKSGIASGYASKYERTGIRAEAFNNDLDRLLTVVANGIRRQNTLRDELGFAPLDIDTLARQYEAAARFLGGFVTDTVLFLNRQLRKPKPSRVLAEGAQAFLLDIDHGMYPYTTSSSTAANGAPAGLGVPAQFIDRVVGVVKAVQSHVGGGPFVTEITGAETLKRLHGDMTTVDAERGATTGRTRRLGYLDLPAIRRAILVSGTTEIALSKLDWVPRFGNTVLICSAYERKGKIIPVAPDAAYKLDQSTPIYESLYTWSQDTTHVRDFDDLPQHAQTYIAFLERKLDTSISMIGVGPQRDQVILR